MWLIMFVAASVAGELQIEADLPVRVVVDEQPVGMLQVPGRMIFETEIGRHTVVLHLAETTEQVVVDVGSLVPTFVRIDDKGAVVVGTSKPDGPPAVVLHTDGDMPLLVLLDRQRFQVSPGFDVTMPLTVGDHALSVRSADGTMIYASGTLAMEGGAGLTVNLLEGRLPQVSGAGGSFRTGQAGR